ncbi:MAG: alpha/beta fold hydrolase [Gammaproteobacteria bacterium]
MIVDVNGASAYAYTAGTQPGGGAPVAVFIHGAANDHSVWTAQARHLAQQDIPAMAIDLPGHGRSAGSLLPGVEDMAGWLLALLRAAGVGPALLIGHSMGSLIALEAAARAPQPIAGLALVGSTYPMRVSPALLEQAQHDEAAAIDMVNLWSHADHFGGPPGTWTLGVARRLMQRMAPGVLHTDLAACNAYAGGEAAARALTCPVHFVFGRLDMMTPPRSTKTLTAAMPHASSVTLEAGHDLMAEQAEALAAELAGFAARVLGVLNR